MYKGTWSNLHVVHTLHFRIQHFCILLRMVNLPGHTKETQLQPEFIYFFNYKIQKTIFFLISYWLENDCTKNEENNEYESQLTEFSHIFVFV